MAVRDEVTPQTLISRLIFALVCVLALLPSQVQAAGTTASGSLPYGESPVTPCPVQDPRGFPVAQLPSSVRFPLGISVPNGASVYGTASPGPPGSAGGGIVFEIAPSGYKCDSAFFSGDGGLTTHLVDPAKPDHKVDVVYSPGGIVPNLLLACPFIPAVRALTAIFQAEYFRPTDCEPPASADITQIPTGDPNLFIAAARLPPNTGSADATLGIFTAARGGSENDRTVLSQSITCTLPSSEVNICKASLASFLTTQSAVGKAMSFLGVTVAALAALSALTQAPPAAAPSPEPTAPGSSECKTNVGLGLEHDYVKHRLRDIHIPGGAIKLPFGLPGEVTLTGSIEDIKVCAVGLTPKLNGTPTSDDPRIAIASDAAGHKGPFVYDLRQAAWTSTPPASKDRPLKTEFQPIDLHPNGPGELSFNQQGKAALVLGSVELRALNSETPLVEAGNMQLRVSVGPTISIRVQISKDSVREKVAEAEKGGLNKDTAIRNVAEQLSSDASVALEEEASQFYGVDAVGRVQVFYAELDQTLVTALEDDALLSSAALADAVASDVALSDAEIAALEERVAAQSIVEFGAADAFLILLALA